jgi:putative endonuclease
MKLSQWLNVLRTLLFGDITGNFKKSSCSRNTIGKHGEVLALRYMKQLGWRLVDNNVRVGIDELDLLLISPDEKVMAIVEVRTTTNFNKSPQSTLTKKKRFRMLRVAKKLRSFAKSHRCALRVDLITVTIQEQNPLIRHYEDIFPIPRVRN